MLIALLLAAAALPPEEVRVRPQALASEIRAQRPWVLSGEAGFNSLSGIGVTVARHLVPNLTLEAGVGTTGSGTRLGGRARVNFLRGEATPFVAAGFLHAPGSGSLQIAAGVDVQTRDGFSSVLSLGFAPGFRDEAGGFVASLSLGYAF